MKKDPNDEITEDFLKFLEVECHRLREDRISTVWVNQHNYAWAHTRWSYRDVRISQYLEDNELEITKPGWLYNKRLRRTIRIDNETLISERKRTSLSTKSERLVPKRGS